MSFWSEAMKGRPVEPFEVPANIVYAPVDPAGRRAAPGRPGVFMEAFIEGTEPGIGPKTAQ
jgi:membrane carboxypeptidase/penicillin-binding protein